MHNKPLPGLRTPQLIKSTLIHKGFCTVRCDDLRLDNGETHPYYTVKTQPKASIILGRTTDGHLLLVEEYRHAVGQVVLGAPGGFVEDSESPEKAARRELLEETGYQSEKWQLLGKAYPLPGLLDQQVYFFLAQDICKIAAPRLEAAENLRTVLLTPSAIQEAISHGRAIDGILCTALFFLNSLGVA